MDEAIHKASQGSKDLLLKLLAPTLPYSLPLYRRLQLSERVKLSGVFTTFSLNSAQDRLPSRFTVGLLDNESPGVNAFLFSSLELQHGLGSLSRDDNDIGENEEDRRVAIKQLLSMLSAIQTFSSKSNDHTPEQHNALLIGTVRSQTASLLRSIPELVLDKVYGKGGPYGKYVFKLSDIEYATEPSLPRGLYYDENIRRTDHELIISNNDLIQNSASLLYLPYGVGIRSEKTDELVAWAFLGVDGCIRTLHVMPEYRRLGLGRAVAAKAARDGLKIFDDNESSERDRFIYADIASSNLPSVLLFENMGGYWVWDSFWLRVDLSKAASLAS